MKTDDLIALLARNVEPVDRRQARRRLTTAVLVGALLALPLMALTLGVNPALQAYMQLPMFWVKLAFGVLLAAAAGWAVVLAGRPGTRLGAVPWGLAAPVVMLWALAIVSLASASPADVPRLVFGDTWRACPVYITVLSIPTLVGALLALRTAAPTHLRRAGALAGLLAGAVGAAVYALHCPELAPPFLAVWYVLGVLIPTGLGSLLAPYALRW